MWSLPPHRTEAQIARLRLSQFRERGLDPREYRGLSELGKYPFCLGQVLKCKRALFLSFVQEATDHLRTAYVLPGAIEKRILHDPLRQGANA
jgi:hypothetical protein